MKARRMKAFCLSLAAVCGLCAAVQTVAQATYFQTYKGFTEKSWTFAISPGGFVGGMDVDTTGGAPTIVYSESGNLARLEDGQPRVIRTGTTGNASSFVVTGLAGGRLMFAETSDWTNYAVQSIGAAGNGEQPVITLAYAFDATLAPNGRVYVSRAESFSGPTDIVLLDAATGATQTVASFEGSSGPLAFDAEGNLYYGTSTGYTQADQAILRISAQSIQDAISGNRILSAQDATCVISGIYAPYDLVVTPDGQVLYSTTVGSAKGVYQVKGGVQEAIATVTSNACSPTNLAWYDGSVFASISGVYGPEHAAQAAFVQLVPEPGGLLCLSGMLAGWAGLTRRRRGGSR